MQVGRSAGRRPGRQARRGQVVQSREQTFTGVGGGRRSGSAVSAIRMSSRMPFGSRPRLRPPLLGRRTGRPRRPAPSVYDVCGCRTSCRTRSAGHRWNQVNACPCLVTTAVWKKPSLTASIEPTPPWLVPPASWSSSRVSKPAPVRGVHLEERAVLARGPLGHDIFGRIGRRRLDREGDREVARPEVAGTGPERDGVVHAIQEKPWSNSAGAKPAPFMSVPFADPTTSFALPSPGQRWSTVACAGAVATTANTVAAVRIWMRCVRMAAAPVIPGPARGSSCRRAG